MGEGLTRVLCWALGNPLLLLDSLAQPEIGQGAWSYGSLICNASLLHMGGLFLSDMIKWGGRLSVVLKGGGD